MESAGVASPFLWGCCGAAEQVIPVRHTQPDVVKSDPRTSTENQHFKRAVETSSARPRFYRNLQPPNISFSMDGALDLHPLNHV